MLEPNDTVIFKHELTDDEYKKKYTIISINNGFAKLKLKHHYKYDTIIYTCNVDDLSLVEKGNEGYLNQLKKEIREAYCFLRKHNQTIPTETLDYMLNASLEKIIKDSH